MFDFWILAQKGLNESTKGLRGLVRWVASLIVVQRSDLVLFEKLCLDKQSELQPDVFLAGALFFNCSVEVHIFYNLLPLRLVVHVNMHVCIQTRMRVRP